MEYRKLLRKSPNKAPRFRRAPAEERTADGHVFDSKAEAGRYGELKIEQKANEVGWLVLQPVFILAGVQYKADFMYLRWLQYQVWFKIVVEEVKPRIKDKKTRREFLRAWKRNAAQMKELHHLDVELVER